LATFASTRSVDSLAIFLLQPDASRLTALEYSRTNEMLDEDSWKLEQDQFRVVRMDSVAPLAREVLEWATPTM
jgi:hypothetical protein